MRVPMELVEPLREVFHRYKGAVAVEEEGGYNPDDYEEPVDQPAVVRAYFPANRLGRTRRARIDVALRLMGLVKPVHLLGERVVRQEEWENIWRAGVHTFRVGKRLVIKPSWEEYGSAGEDIVVEMGPGIAFGTGYHPTTRMCMEALEEHVGAGMRVLDVGTGSGILAIVAAKLGAREVLALDIDPLAVRVARQNARANGVFRQVRVRRGTLPVEGLDVFDLVVANIGARFFLERAGELLRVLAPGGVLVAAGFLGDQREGVREALTGAGLEVRADLSDGEWGMVVGNRQR